MRFHYDCGENGRNQRHAGGRSFRFGPFDFDFDFDNGAGRGNWGGGRRGRERKRMFEGGELRLVLLKLIADEPRHGYELIKAIDHIKRPLVRCPNRATASFSPQCHFYSYRR